MFWLDWYLFGHGRGMASPFFDDAFYWLVDTLGDTRSAKNGRFYRVSSGLGAQLQSIEWFMPPPGTRRRLAGMEFVVFNAHRKLLRVDVSWSIYGGARDAIHAREVAATVKNWGHGR